MSRLFPHEVFRQIIADAYKGQVADHPAPLRRATKQPAPPPPAPGIVIGTVNIYIERPRPSATSSE